MKIKIANGDGRLMRGMISDITVATGKETDVIAIPVTSVVRDADDLTYVFVVSSDKRTVRKGITVGGPSGNAVILTSGLSQGESIIIRGQKNVQDGQAVSVNSGCSNTTPYIAPSYLII